VIEFAGGQGGRGGVKEWTMKLQDLTVGMKVAHPQYGEGVVEKISNVDAAIRFDNVLRTIDPQLAEVAPAEATARVEGLTVHGCSH
jgi:hypothetical protein